MIHLIQVHRSVKFHSFIVIGKRLFPNIFAESHVKSIYIKLQ